MNFQNSLFFMSLLVGLIFVIVGFIVFKFPPKNINYLYGYRTKSSMKSKERWNFAQKYSSKLMIYCGLGLIALSISGLVFKVTVVAGVIISITFMFIAVAILLIKTEKAIKQNF